MAMTSAPPANVKITVYMQAGALADLEVARAELVRSGLNVDRGRMVRAALRVADRYGDEWLDEITREEE